MMWKRFPKFGNDQSKPQISRRNLLQGKFWKLIRPGRYTPLVMRYPRTAAEVASRDSDAPGAEPLGPPSVEPATASPKTVDAATADTESSGSVSTGQSQGKPATRHIGGIAIEAVAPTRLSSASPPRTIPLFRPPGAIDELQFLAGCTRCNECAKACPHDAIRNAPERLGAIAGTPTIEADTAACMMCDDFPCIAACEPGVLVDSIPKVMGTAKVTEHLCLAFHGTTCTVCSERCPVPGVIEISQGKPTIQEDACVGCGVCRYVCPAPENAILLMPAFIRPALPTT